MVIIHTVHPVARHCTTWTMRCKTSIYIQGVSGGKVSILGDHSIGHSTQRKCICACVQFRTVSETELFHCTITELLIRKRYYVPFLILICIDKVGTVYLVYIIHFRKFHRGNQYTVRLVWGERVSMFGICEDVPYFSQNSYIVSMNSHNGQLTLHTDSHAAGKGNTGHQIQTTVQWNSCLGNRSE
jgi:hypothetical protein